MAQTMQAFIANMLEMRKQEADAARFRAAMQQKQQEEWADFASQMGQGITSAITKNAPSARDRLANQMMQAEYTIPGAQRAQAVNPSMQGPADALRNQMYTGGMQEFEMRQKMEDQLAQRGTEAARLEGATQRNLTSSAYLALAEDRAAANTRAEARQAELDKIKAEQAEVDRARQLFSASTKEYQAKKANADAYKARMSTFMKGLGHAKTPEEYQLAVDQIDSEYQAGIGTGLKVEKPLIRPYIDEEQRAAIQREEMKLKAMPRYPGTSTDIIPDWLQGGRVAAEQRATAAEQALQAMPGYAQTRPDYVPPEQPAGIFPSVGSPPEVPAILGGAGPNPTAAQAVGGSGGGGTSMPTVPLADALKVDPTAAVGKIMTDGYGNKARVGP